MGRRQLQPGRLRYNVPSRAGSPKIFREGGCLRSLFFVLRSTSAPAGLVKIAKGAHFGAPETEFEKRTDDHDRLLGDHQGDDAHDIGHRPR